MSVWKTYLAVGLGSGLGSLLRYAFSLMSQAVLGSHFPWGTLIVNVAGSFLIGWIATTALHAPHAKLARWHPFLVAGFCGGFTTFSVFSLETLHFVVSGKVWLALFYMLMSLPLWLLAAMAGGRLASRSPLPR